MDGKRLPLWNSASALQGQNNQQPGYAQYRQYVHQQEGPGQKAHEPRQDNKKDTIIMVSNRLTEAFPDWAWKFAQEEAAAAIPAAEAQLYALCPQLCFFMLPLPLSSSGWL